MDQKALRELEHRCIQEEPPWCSAACPLHVDARSVVGHIAQGQWAAAWTVLRKKMPLPAILGRICDAPCEARCKRGEAGEAIRIGALERALVQTSAPPSRVVPLPAKDKQVALIGSGPSSLTAAWDLIRKGYGVTVFDTGNLPGAALHQMNPAVLPPAVIEGEIATLAHLGVVFQLGCDGDAMALARRCLKDFDAAYLGLDAVDSRDWKTMGQDDRLMPVDEKTLSTSQPGLFAGGRSGSPVWQAAQGRWAATSIDRFLQGVSLTAGRDREGPVETRLFTSLADVAPQPAVAMADAVRGYTDAEATAEARRCLSCECLECVKVCAYLEQFRAYPKRYTREIYNNLSIVMGDHPANRLINACSLCGLCEAVCPNDFAMQDLCLEARQAMVASGKMPPSAHEFALLDMAFSQADGFSMARHQPGHSESAQVFFPGCQLCASAPGQVEAVYAHLRKALAGGVGLVLGCCAAPAQWAGRQAAFETQARRTQAQWEALGKPRMILACSTCLAMFTQHLPMIPAVSLWSVLEAHRPAHRGSDITGPLAIHDPCTTRHTAPVQKSVRRLLAGCPITVEELDLGEATTECCGFGGLMQNAAPELAGEVARRRANRSRIDYLAYCAMCRDNLAATGKRVIHLLDLFFADPRHPDPALRPRPGWSERQENRARLKARLLEQLWNEAPQEMKSHQTIKLEISPELAERLDRRRILIDDLQRVIEYAEASGDRLVHLRSGHYKAAHAPFKVTFWVEYSPTETGYIVHNAYTHRMEVIGP